MEVRFDEARRSNTHSGAICEGGLWLAPGGIQKVATSCRLRLMLTLLLKHKL